MRSSKACSSSEVQRRRAACVRLVERAEEELRYAVGMTRAELLFFALL